MLIRSTLLSALLTTAGCSSIMSHSGADQGYYPGTRADIELMKSDDTGWVMTPLIALDLPLSILADTLLLPLDYYRAGGDRTSDSPHERVLQSENKNKATSSNSRYL